MQQILSGDEESVRRLIERYWPYIFKIVLSIVRHPNDAEDVTQEVFVQIFLSLPRYRFSGLKTWMTRITVNKSIDFKRKTKRMNESLVGEVETVVQSVACSGDNDVETQLFERENSRYLLERLTQLPETYRFVVWSYYIGGKSYHQIAGELGIAVKTVESRLYRAKAWMRQHWKEEYFR